MKGKLLTVQARSPVIVCICGRLYVYSIVRIPITTPSWHLIRPNFPATVNVDGTFQTTLDMLSY